MKPSHVIDAWRFGPAHVVQHALNRTTQVTVFPRLWDLQRHFTTEIL